MRRVDPLFFLAVVTLTLCVAAWVVDQQSHANFGNTLPYMTVKIGPDDIYPPVPGSINPAVSQQNIQQTICKSGWTANIRPKSVYTTKLKVQQMQLYGLTGPTANYEEDHLVSLELGGDPTDPNNLWPERYTASIADGGARTKDKVEDFLHRQVCSGSMTLLEAQQSIAIDWYLIYVNNLKGKYGSIEPVTDQDDE